MNKFPRTLAEAAQCLQGRLFGKDTPFQGISIDSRKIQRGELFIAFAGERFDGHDFIAQAAEQGAAGALVQKSVKTSLPTIQVTNSKHALGALAKSWREQFAIPVVGITGSCGKTTTKTLLANILSSNAPTLANPSSFNNDIGLPITLLQLRPEHRYAVIEIGTNHPGEIAYLCTLAQPNIAAITMVASVHSEFLGDVDAIAQEKGALYQALPPDGTAILNIDDPHHTRWKNDIHKRRCITFGLTDKADVYTLPSEIRLNDSGQAMFTLHMRDQNTSVSLQLLGRHNINNALAAAAVACALNVPLEKIAAGLKNTAAPYSRGIWKRGMNNSWILDDAYNANPTAFRAAIQTLLARPAKKRMIVMGKMSELGQEAPLRHAEIGALAKSMGIDELHAVGEFTDQAVNAFGDGGFSYADKASLIAALPSRLADNVAVLVKGSQSAKMAEVVIALQA